MDATVVSKIMHEAKNDFLSRNRDLIACVRGGAAQLLERISADLSVDQDAEIAINSAYNELTSDDSDVAGDALTHSNRLVRDYATGTLRHAFLKQISLSFLRLRTRGAIQYAISLTSEAQAQEFRLEIDAGCRSITARPAKAQTAAESLDEQIKLDWAGRLRTDQIRAKKAANPQYAAALDAMLNEGTLQ